MLEAVGYDVTLQQIWKANDMFVTLEGEDVRVTGDLRKLQPPSRLDRHAEELVEQILRLDPQAEYEVPSRKQSGEGTDE